MVVLQTLKKIRELEDMCGRDRIQINTVAFGDPKEDYLGLQKVRCHSRIGIIVIFLLFKFSRFQISVQLPQSSFQKLSPSNTMQRTAFSSLSFNLSTMWTDAGAQGG